MDLGTRIGEDEEGGIGENGERREDGFGGGVWEREILKKCRYEYNVSAMWVTVFAGSGCGIPEGVMGRTNLIIEPQVQQATLYKTGEELSFSCQTGFLLLGAEKISCQPGGPWSAIVPECVGKYAFSLYEYK